MTPTDNNNDNALGPNATMQLHLQQVPPSKGTLWIRHGFQVFRRKPLALTGLFAVFVLLASLVQILPFAGTVLACMAPPLLSLGFMLATHQVLQNKTPTASIYLAPLRLTPQRRKSQLLLCASYAMGVLLVGLLSHWIDDGSLAALMKLMSDGAPEEQISAAMARPEMLWGSLSRLGLLALLSVPFWHASALVHWGGQGVLQALFSSTLGVWRNKGAFAVNALAWVGLLFAMGLTISLLTAVLGMAQLTGLLVVPLGLIASTIFYCSLYFSFVDCFMFGTPKELP